MYYIMPRTEAQKNAQRKWIEKNKEIYDESQRILALKYYYAHREELLLKKKEYYQAKKLKKQEQQQDQPTP